MLGGVSYEEVAAGRPARAPRLREVLGLLERFTRVKWRLVPSYRLLSRLDRVPFPDWPVVVYIRPPWRFRLNHCVAVKGPFVHDPNDTKAVRLDRYDKGHWRVVFVLAPAGAAGPETA
jgi:hypothetical protein